MNRCTFKLKVTHTSKLHVHHRISLHPFYTSLQNYYVMLLVLHDLLFWSIQVLNDWKIKKRVKFVWSFWERVISLYTYIARSARFAETGNELTIGEWAFDFRYCWHSGHSEWHTPVVTHKDSELIHLNAEISVGLKGLNNSTDNDKTVLLCMWPFYFGWNYSYNELLSLTKTVL